MNDIGLIFGGDLSLGPTGDLATVTGTQATQQRVFRRLLTPRKSYIQHLDYGAGLAEYVGQANPATRIQANVRQQLRLESGVARVPPAGASITSSPDGTYVLTVTYSDQATGQGVTVSGPIGT